MEIRAVNAGNGWTWIVDGFNLFKQSPVIWIALFFIYLLIAMALTFIPFVGSVVLNLLAPVFMAGFMLGCKALENGDELEINHLFAGFSQHTSRLVTVGGIYLAGAIVIFGIVFLVFGAGVLGALGGHGLDEAQRSAAGEKALLAILIAIAVMMPLIMAYWFAPTLVVFHDIQPLEAMKLSFRACLNNIMPFLVYGLASLVLMILAAIPIGLGLLVMIPTMTASLYASYKDIFNPLPNAGGELAL